MHSTIPARTSGIFIIILVLAGCAFAGCTAPHEGPQPNRTANATDIGFRPEPGPGGGTAISFAEALSSIGESVPDGNNTASGNISSRTRILYVNGIRMDADGNAAGWVFIVNTANRTSVVTVETKGTTLAAWKGTVPPEEIRTGSIVTPGDLFGINRPLLSAGSGENQTVSRDLTLSNNTYTVTISGGGERKIMKFDAQTGAPLRTNG